MASLKEISSLFGFDIADDKDFDLDKFKSHVNGKYIDRTAALDDEDLKTKIVGTRMGKLESKILQSFGIKAADVKDKKVEEIIEVAATNVNATIEKYKKAATEGADKRVTDLTAELEQKKKETSDLETLLTSTKTEFDTYRSESDGKFKSYKVNDKFKNTLSQVTFIDGFEKDAVRQAGFNAVIGGKYKFDLNDKDELVVLNAEGHRIPSKVKTGEHASPLEILTSEAEANALLKKNNGKQPTVNVRQQQNDNGEFKPTRQLNTRALENANRG